MNAGDGSTTDVVRNWAGSVEFTPAMLTRPGSVDELRQVVADAATARRRVRAIGSLHSFNDIVATEGVSVATDRLDRIVEIDVDAMTVTVEAGVRYTALGRFLHDEGLALHNLASLPHLTVAGAVATGTHGSGDSNQLLAGAVQSIDLVTSTGELRRIHRDSDEGVAAIVGLGGFGVVARLTLRVEPTFDVAQEVLTDLPFEVGARHLDELLASAYSVSLFTDWRSDVFHQVWRKHRTEGGGSARAVLANANTFGATPASARVHPVPGMSAVACTEQLGRRGPWYLRLPHFRADAVPSVGAELQSEFFVARAHAADALRAVREVRDHLAGVTLVTEVRSVAADELWLSPAYLRDSVAIHFTWRPDPTRVREALGRIEAALTPFAPRPHWGKVTTMSASSLRRHWPRFGDAVARRAAMDPDGTFLNGFLVERLADDAG